MTTVQAEPTVVTTSVPWPHGLTLSIGALAGMVGRDTTVIVGQDRHPAKVARIDRKADTVHLVLEVPPAVAAVISTGKDCASYSIGFTPR